MAAYMQTPCFDLATLLGFQPNSLPPPPYPPTSLESNSMLGNILYVPTPTPLPPVSTVGHSSSAQLKRASEDFPMIANGSGVEYNGMDGIIEHDVKKVRLEAVVPEAPPSRVIHIRNIPTETTEGDIAQLGVPFGAMTNMVLAKKKSQALLEMATVETATNMVQYYILHPPQIRGRTVLVQYSNHQELKTEQANVAAEAALKMANSMSSSAANEEVKCVLRVIIENYVCIVTIGTLQKIFSRFGTVQKIVTFSKNNTFQVLIEMLSAVEANTAKVILNGQNIYTGCCTLRIDFSKLNSLNVKYNNEKSRDYTNNNLPSGTPTQEIACSDGTIMLPEQHMAGLPPPTFGGFNMTMMPPFQNFIHPSSLMLSQFLLSAGVPPMAPMLVGLQSVLLVSNLDEEKATPDSLFTLFGIYGDVVRVKIMFNKKDNALVQYSDPSQAQIGMQYLNGVKVWGRYLKITFSKHNQVQLPKEGTEGGGLTKDYTNSPLHRFKQPNSKNFLNVFPPSNVLHLSNVPAICEEQEICELFERFNHHIVVIRFYQKEKKMALIQMASEEDAILALMDLHNYQMNDNFHIRLSFSKAMV